MHSNGKVSFNAALFDLDGVVFDTEPQYTEFWGSQCREFHPEHPGLEIEIKGQTLSQIYERYFSGALESARPLITARLDDFERNMEFDYIKGFTDFVACLHRNGVRTAVVTSSNKQKMAAVATKRPEMQRLFDAVLTAEDFVRSKPDPDCYLKGAQRFGAKEDECIVFEDSFNGLKSGRTANMTVIGLATTNPEELIRPYSDMVINDYTGLTFDRCAQLLLERNKG